MLSSGDIALIISAFSALMSLSSLGWNIVSFRSSGARVNVRPSYVGRLAEPSEANSRYLVNGSAIYEYTINLVNRGRHAIDVVSIHVFVRDGGMVAPAFRDSRPEAEKSISGPRLAYKLEPQTTGQWQVNYVLLAQAMGNPDEDHHIEVEVLLGNGAKLRGSNSKADEYLYGAVIGRRRR